MTPSTEAVRAAMEKAGYHSHVSAVIDVLQAAYDVDFVALRAEKEKLRVALKDLIEDHEYMTDTDAEEDNMARAAARAALKDTGNE